MYKKIISLLLLNAFVFSPAFCATQSAKVLKEGVKPSAAQITKSIAPSNKTVKLSDTIVKKNINQDVLVPKKLEATMKNSIAHIYGKDRVDMIYGEVYEIIKKSKDKRSIELLKEDLARPSDWYKDEVIYMFYPDQFGSSRH